MYIKILIVLIFHTTFAFQGCKMHEFKQEKPADFAHAYKKSENKDINNASRIIQRINRKRFKYNR